MKISIIGAGHVATALANSFMRARHDVVLGVREISANKTPTALPALSVGEATQGADLVLLAVPFDALEDVARSLDLPDGQILVDVSNPLRTNPLGLSIGGEDSGGERVAKLFPTARVVKAFNTTGWENLADPRRTDGPALILPVVGDDGDAKATVLRLARDAGWDAINAGPLSNAQLTEPFGVLWIWLAHSGGLGRDVAFALTRSSGTPSP